MVGDWIKITIGIARDPSVLRIAETVKLPPHDVVGKLVDIWGWASHQTANGKIAPATGGTLDALVGLAGFAAAMADAGWLDMRDGYIQFPKWDRHNSSSAKKRILAAQRSSRKRSRARHADSVTESAPRARATQGKTKQDEERSSSNGRSAGDASLETNAAANLNELQIRFCSLLLDVKVQGRSLYSPKTAAGIARTNGLTEPQVAWAISRLREVIAESGAPRNPGGYLRSLITNEKPPDSFVQDYMRQQVARGAIQSRLDAGRESLKASLPQTSESRPSNKRAAEVGTELTDTDATG
ncbi:MAG: hypothetical protein L6Q35_10240 [Phycisphaerales bacterium]|nr:hypothetical protein [Phycisphaerales bacterium]